VVKLLGYSFTKQPMQNLVLGNYVVSLKRLNSWPCQNKYRQLLIHYKQKVIEQYISVGFN